MYALIALNAWAVSVSARSDRVSTTLSTAQGVCSWVKGNRDVICSSRGGIRSEVNNSRGSRYLLAS